MFINFRNKELTCWNRLFSRGAQSAGTWERGNMFLGTLEEMAGTLFLRRDQERPKQLGFLPGDRLKQTKMARIFIWRQTRTYWDVQNFYLLTDQGRPKQPEFFLGNRMRQIETATVFLLEDIPKPPKFLFGVKPSRLRQPEFLLGDKPRQPNFFLRYEPK